MRMCRSRTNKALPARRRPAVALCLVGVWFSGGCNIDQLLDQDWLPQNRHGIADDEL